MSNIDDQFTNAERYRLTRLIDNRQTRSQRSEELLTKLQSLLEP